MKSHPNNPPENDLQTGVSETELVAAVSKSGYPLQSVVSGILGANFSITDEWGFVDRGTGENRTLDIFAYKKLEPHSDHLSVGLTLLVECKQSDHPFVFFPLGESRVPRGFPAMFGFGRNKFELHKGNSTMYVAPADFACLGDMPFVGKGPPIAATFARAERKERGRFELSGSVPFNQVVLPLISAFTHLQSKYVPTPNRDKYFASIVICLCVVDATMVVATGTPEDPQLELHPWVRTVRQEATEDKWEPNRFYVVDCVHRAFLAEYIEKHLLPFGHSVATRLIEKERIVMDGKATVSDLSKWSWIDVQSAS